MEQITNFRNKYDLVVELATLVWNNQKLFFDVKKLRIFKEALNNIEEEQKIKIELTLNGDNVELTSEEIIKNIYEIKKFYKILNIENVLNNSDDKNIISKMELDELLKITNLDAFSIWRINELYNNNDIRDIYEKEIEKREEWLDIILKWDNHLMEIVLIDSKIQKIKKFILWFKVKKFNENKKINSAESSLLFLIDEKLQKFINKKNDLLNYKEISLSYRLYKLKKYKKSLDNSNFVITSSREKYITEIEDKILSWKSVLLTWPTWTWKTVLAINAIKNIQKSLVNISWKKINSEFVEVLSWNSWTRISDFITKIKLTEWKNGWTETSSELWKILKAFVDWKIPVIDEIDLIPNDILMRIKHLLTLNPWDKYSPQENWNEVYILKNTTLIATANIKSEKHEEREDLDPAIIRLFDGINVKYFPEDEIYDLFLASLMSDEWFISNISLSQLKWEKSILLRLIYALKDIEKNYLWYWDWETINDWNNDVDEMFLQKAVFETWKIMWILKWFDSTKIDLSLYIRDKIIGFISNWAYPKTDRFILLKIFSSKWIISQEDIQKIIDKVSDMSKSEIKENLLENTYVDNSDIKFIDPFELSNFDPFNNFSFDEKEFLDNDLNIIGLIRELNIYITNKYLENVENISQSDEKMYQALWEELNKIIDYYNNYKSITLTDKQKEKILWILFSLNELNFIEKLWKNKIFSDFKNKVKIFINNKDDIIDSKKKVEEEFLKNKLFEIDNEISNISHEKELLKTRIPFLNISEEKIFVSNIFNIDIKIIDLNDEKNKYQLEFYEQCLLYEEDIEQWNKYKDSISKIREGFISSNNEKERLKKEKTDKLEELSTKEEEIKEEKTNNYIPEIEISEDEIPF